MHGWTEGIDTSKKDNAGEALFRSGMIGGMGTDEARLIRTVMFATRHDLKLIIQAYDQKFKRNMVKDVQSETKQMPGLAGSFAKQVTVCPPKQAQDLMTWRAASSVDTHAMRLPESRKSRIHTLLLLKEGSTVCRTRTSAIVDSRSRVCVTCLPAGVLSDVTLACLSGAWYMR